LGIGIGDWGLGLGKSLTYSLVSSPYPLVSSP